MTLDQQRNTLRKLIRERRRQLNPGQQHIAAIKLAEKLKQHDKVARAKHIGLYLANDGEIDPAPFINWCWLNNKQVYLPILHPFSKGHLVFQHYTEQTTLTANKFGIPEPALDVTTLCPTAQMDIIFTPLVAFDNQGNRLGMGGGFYDRTLSQWQKDSEHTITAKKVAIGLAHRCQEVDDIPFEHWDIPLAEIITD